jgi:hypothetical protein
MPDHVLGDRRLGDLKPEFQQFPVDTRGAPQGILLAHLSNEFALLAGNPGPARSATRFPAPIGSKSCSMPTQDRVRLNHAGQTEQAWPEPCHPHQQGSVSPTQTKTVRCTPHRDIELMAQIQVLNFKSTSRLEPVCDKSSEQVEQRKHHNG